MGAWSHEPFGNDDANDWAYGLKGTDDLALVEAALDRVLDAEGYLEAPEASEAVAAAEVLAKLLGKGTQSDAYTEKVDEWVNAVAITPSPDILSKALKALDRVLGDESELNELWSEDDNAEWVASINALRTAVGA